MTGHSKISTSQFIKIEIKDKLAVITLCQPRKKNAINTIMYEDLTRCLNFLSENDEVSITVITGSGDFYSSGTDLLDGLKENSDSAIKNASIRLQ